ncbi:origin recognition complex subunit 2 [Mucor ambiguus]|uniref:Origin recognition complex subunit 2 n=1 Tax=Mucor ambiguus TaxID=91626 RepID=A0A0C9MZG1_9FUNG|nr:origin recognition complex subunit 2 [Mucor ambiguus]
MKILEQTDDEIPIHIVSSVDAETLRKEEQLARLHRVKRRRNSEARKVIDVGLTVSRDGSDKTASARRRQMNVEPQQNVEEDADMDQVETGEVLAHYKAKPDGDGDADADKENVDVSGRSIFTFQQTIRKSANTMMKKALVEEEAAAAAAETSTASTSRRKKTKAPSKTQSKNAPDHAKRRRIQRQMELLKDNHNDDEDPDEIPESSDEEEEGSGQTQRKLNDDDDESEEEEIHQRKSMFVEQEGYERYFQDLHGSSKTSNNTLSKLQVLEPQEFHQILQAAPTKHLQEIGILSEMHKQHFPQWFFELHSGFNLVFYGYGSKRNLLNEFAQSALTDGPLVVVNGFFPSISIKDILLKITAGALGTTGPTGSIQDHVEFICDYFASEDRDYESLYIVVHNLDGPNLRNERTQTALSMLANASNIHLVASVDHLNAGLLWDNVKATRFNWIWHDATTYDDYLVETSFENSLLVRTGELGGARGAKFVLDSLTSNARGVFKILAEHQLMEMGIQNMEGRGNETVGLTYSQYYQKCREGFFVSSDLALRTELTEFRDHKLISTKKNLDGTELFFIPLDQSTLVSIVEELN